MAGVRYSRQKLNRILFFLQKKQNPIQFLSTIPCTQTKAPPQYNCVLMYLSLF